MTAETTLKQLEHEVSQCQACGLASGRTRSVPGSGPLTARVMFIGEGPGFNEDKQGLPFVGQAGKLLEQMLAKITLNRTDVYITNVVKCRPPNNRDPLPEELAACGNYLDRQLLLIRPELIVTLGRFSMARWFANEKISIIHGKPKRFDKTVVMPLFHPAAALRNPQWLKLLEEDFLKIPRILAKLDAEKAQATPSPATPSPTSGEQLTLF
ncbi:MAG TPA: uracil-DNA glycosylase [Anaerolineales bacterium]|nr:uracil-DNA glycosylase [Anaerolineales bacterium]